MERRSCDRFEIPGTTVSYKKKGLLGMGNIFVETSCPIIELSCGGIRFLNQNSLSLNDQVLVEIALLDENLLFSLQGQVRWCDPHTERSYRYQTGVQFNPYGRKKGWNDPGILKKLKGLEEKFKNP